MTKLWLLRPVGYDTEDQDKLWDPWYDKAFGFIVRAATEAEARAFAAADGGDEPARAWESPEHSTCVELGADGPAGVVMQDFHAA